MLGDINVEDIYTLGDINVEDIYTLGDINVEDIYTLGDINVEDIYTLGDIKWCLWKLLDIFEWLQVQLELVDTGDGQWQEVAYFWRWQEGHLKTGATVIAMLINSVSNRGYCNSYAY